jgi:hypothetical protein
MPLPIKIEHRIGVQTPAEVIWKIISDIPGWPAWNPLYTKAAGEVRFGAKLTFEVALPGETPRPLTATVLDWTPNEQILWNVSMFAGLLRTTRYVEIETLPNGNCIFSNGEIFEGPMIRFLGKRTRKAVKAGFTAMGEAVRDRAEALWKSEGPSATSGAG